MNATEIQASEVQVGDRIIVSRSGRSRFALIVDRIHDMPNSSRVIAGRRIRITNPNVVFNQNKVSTLRPTTRIERFPPTLIELAEAGEL